MKNARSNIPSSWQLSSLGKYVAKGSHSIIPNKTPKDIFELYSVPSHGRGSPEIIAGAEIKSNKQVVEIDTVLLCKINPRINRSWVVNAHSKHTKIASTEWITFPPNDDFEPKYLAYYLKQDSVRDFLAANASGVGGSLMRVRPTTIKDYPFPIAPKNEQKLIVAEIEKQFSRLDEAVAGLKRVKANLKRYKAAVLKASVEGKLTEEWRNAHPEVEPASELLKRILAERRARWEAAELARMKLKGKKVKDDKWKKEYIEPVALPGFVPLFGLPKGWCWATVNQVGSLGEQAVLTGPFGSNIGKSDFQTSGIPVLTIGCLKEEGVFLDNAAYISESKARELDRYRLNEGDLLFSRMAAVGRAGYVTKEISGAIFNYHIMRLRLSTMAIDPHFFISYVRGAKTVIDYVREVNHGATRDGINTDQLLAMPVALPPLSEQREIMQAVDSKLSLVHELEKEIDNNMSRANRMRQAILNTGFSGKMVAQ